MSWTPQANRADVLHLTNPMFEISPAYAQPDNVAYTTTGGSTITHNKWGAEATLGGTSGDTLAYNGPELRDLRYPPKSLQVIRCTFRQTWTGSATATKFDIGATTPGQQDGVGYDMVNQQFFVTDASQNVNATAAVSNPTTQHVSGILTIVGDGDKGEVRFFLRSKSGLSTATINTTAAIPWRAMIDAESSGTSQKLQMHSFNRYIVTDDGEQVI